MTKSSPDRKTQSATTGYHQTAGQQTERIKSSDSSSSKINLEEHESCLNLKVEPTEYLRNTSESNEIDFNQPYLQSNYGVVSKLRAADEIMQRSKTEMYLNIVNQAYEKVNLQENLLPIATQAHDQGTRRLFKQD